MDTPKPQEIYRHFKGNLYQIVTIAQHSETEEQLVIYQALYGDCKVYARPLSMFLSPVDKNKYPDATQHYRFERMTLQSQLVASAANSVNVSGIANADTNVDANANTNASAGINADPNADFKLDPDLDAFLEADKMQKKLEILVNMKNKVTDDMLNTMAYSVDFTLADGDLMSKYESLKNGLLILERYESDRRK